MNMKLSESIKHDRIKEKNNNVIMKIILELIDPVLNKNECCTRSFGNTSNVESFY